MPFPASTLYPGALTFPDANHNWPTTVFEVEFTAGTWTNITPFVRGISAARGRQYELGESDAGRITVALDNRDGRFDPQNVSSPYSPNVKLRKRIRHKITWSGTTKTLWTGYVTKWPQDWAEAGNFQMVALEATDILGVLKGKEFGEHIAAEKTSQYALNYWWPLEAQDNAGYTPELVAGVMNGQARTFGGSVSAKAGGAGDIGGVKAGGFEGASVAQFTPDVMGSPTPTRMGVINLMRITNGQSLSLPATPWTLNFMCQSSGKPAAGGWATMVDFTDSTGGGQFLRIACDSRGFIWFIIKDQNGSIHNTIWGVQVADGQPHCISLEFSGSGSGLPKMYFSVDGGGYGTINSGNPSGWQFNNLVDLNVGGLWPRQGATGVQGTRPWSGLIGNVAIFAGALVTSGVLSGTGSQPDIVVNGFTGDTTDARIQNAMTLAGQGSMFTALDTGDATLQSAKFGGKDAASVILEPIPWEQGNLFVRGDGQVCFSSRSYRYQPVSAFSVGTGTSYPVTVLGLDYDDTHIINSAKVSRDGGGTTIVNDATSQNTYGLFSSSGYDSEGVRDDNQCSAQAQYLVRRYANPLTRIRSVVLDCAGHPALFALVVQLEIEQCITVQHTPLAGTPVSQVCWVESIQYDSTPDVFNVTLQLSPADTTGWLVANDATKGVLDTSANALSF